MKAVEAQGGPEVASYPRAISLGIILLDSIVDQLPRRADRAVSVAYKHHAYDVVNDQLDAIALRLSREPGTCGIQSLSYTRFPESER